MQQYVEKRLEAAILLGFGDYLAEEVKAVEIRCNQGDFVPGLLQAPRYARALLAAGMHTVVPAADAPVVGELEARTAFRLGRADILARENPPFLWAIIEEAVLLRPIGGREAMREQLDHLLAIADLPNVSIQVAPFALAEHNPLLFNLNLLTRPDGSVLGYTESLYSGTLVKERAVVDGWMRSFTHLQVGALSKLESRELIRRIREERYA
ncbi:DUF5753 domain-containing protein [Kitasatospora sp. NPDC006697]|uniref:DUF5753 domain-containing protein n=1 Tax=Kitasatospora sp. NPDC006697 TaxID=3364020 RepID=UPI003680D675